MDVIIGTLLGLVAGTIFSPIILRLFGIGYAKLDKNVDHLEKK